MSDEERRTAGRDYEAEDSGLDVTLDRPVVYESLGNWAPIVGAALGYGLGIVFALGGVWPGLVATAFTLAGAVLGRILWGGQGGHHA
ncbi:MAG: hypothetical protein AB7W28_00850 [Armatimonadota bacterium]